MNHPKHPKISKNANRMRIPPTKLEQKETFHGDSHRRWGLVWGGNWISKDTYCLAHEDSIMLVNLGVTPSQDTKIHIYIYTYICHNLLSTYIMIYYVWLSWYVWDIMTYTHIYIHIYIYIYIIIYIYKYISWYHEILRYVYTSLTIYRQW